MTVCLAGFSAGLAAQPPVSGATTSGCAGAGLQPDANNAAAVDAATLCLIDRVRASRGLRALHANRSLHGVATRQTSEMLRWDYFADVRPSGVTPMSLVLRTPYSRGSRLSVGQNIAWGTAGFSTPAHVVSEWMASPPHRKIMLAPIYRDAGIAIAPALPSVLGVGSHGAVYVAEFGAHHR